MLNDDAGDNAPMVNANAEIKRRNLEETSEGEV